MVERRRARPRRIYRSPTDREVISLRLVRFRQPDLYACPWCHTPTHLLAFLRFLDEGRDTHTQFLGSFGKEGRATRTSLPTKIWKKSLFQRHGIIKEKMGKEGHFISVSQTQKTYASLCRVLITWPISHLTSQPHVPVPGVLRFIMNTNGDERTWDISCSFFEDPNILKNGNGRGLGGRSRLYIFSPNNKVINRGLRYFWQTRVCCSALHATHRHDKISDVIIESEQRKLMSWSFSYFIFQQNKGVQENIDCGV
jgi:hypothetical protein